jgi:hypothetical protein
MAANLNYTTDPCENIPNNYPWPLIGKYKFGYMIKVFMVMNKS